MSGPGQGRYTTYVPNASDKNKMLSKLFNERSPNGRGEIYGAAYQTDPAAAAKSTVDRATANVTNGVGGVIPADGIQTGDINMFPTGVNLNFEGGPNTGDVKWQNPGDPANGYVPDLSSPGAGRTDPTQKDVDPGIKPADVKPNYVAGTLGSGTQAPSALSVKSPIGKNLVMGKSSV